MPQMQLKAMDAIIQYSYGFCWATPEMKTVVITAAFLQLMPAKASKSVKQCTTAKMAQESIDGLATAGRST